MPTNYKVLEARLEGMENKKKKKIPWSNTRNLQVVAPPFFFLQDQHIARVWMLSEVCADEKYPFV